MRIAASLNEPRTDGDLIANLAAEIQAAADDGFSSAWMANIFGVDALIALAVAGRDVPGIELGTAVVPTYPRHPAAIAQQALTVQAALGGRLALGIGLSHQIVIENMYGYSFDRPARHMKEYLAVLVPLLDGQPAAVDGETLSAHIGLSLPATPRIPLLLAALAPRMLALAGSVADGTVLWMTGPQTIESHIVPRLKEAADSVGRPAPRVVCTLPVCVTDDADAARAKANDVFAIYGSLPSYRAMLDKEGAAGPGDVAIVGSEQQVIEAIEALGPIGVTDFVAAEFAGGAEAERTRAVLRDLCATHNG